jgi:hypothetical protein
MFERFRLPLIFGGLLLGPPGSFAAGPACAPNSGFEAIDVSQQITDAFAKQLKAIGVRSIIRYYDWENETIKGKTLTRRELDIIARNKLSVAVVFQHHNDQVQTFEDPNRGRQDALRSLELARKFSQPKGSAVYFGVDGVDAKFSAIRRGLEEERFGLSEITNYFQQVNNVFRGSGLSVGVYGSGLVCRVLLHKKLAKYCWLANATSWPEYSAYEASKQWALKQLLTTKASECFGFAADLSLSNAPDSRYGQWEP